jgi:signal transduction histidine kinase
MLTEDILDITKIESESLNLKKERFNLNDIVANSIEDMTTNKQFSKVERNLVRLQYHVPEIFVEADKGRICQVIHNLLDNAMKFTNIGVISINAQFKNRDKNDDEQLVVSVRDAGSGIDPEIMPKLFTKFATKSDGGSGTGLGLGLYISKSIVEAHGGRIWAENNADGKGATFYFSLPLSR